ncbi:MAG: chitobiase/beta-hexosaminidase C-terminal domain-containing protein [Candidatus Stygibacter frigidus]|nr:chitobiase/beta-hexosaminidase C-terminal domain-containing protein [Candidatus Stygibacter frigidus]
MKRLLFVLVIMLSLIVGCEKKSTEPENEAPGIPSNPIPANGSSNLSVDTDLSWSCSDPDGDALTYDVYFGTSSNPSLVSSDQSSSSFDSGTMNYGATYYWKIAANDGENETVSPIWSFTTLVTQNVATPIFNPSGGTYTTTLDVSIYCSTSGATIRYTLNGTEPTTSSNLYMNPISLSSSTTMKAKAFKNGWNESNTITANYIIEELEEWIQCDFPQILNGIWKLDSDNYPRFEIDGHASPIYIWDYDYNTMYVGNVDEIYSNGYLYRIKVVTDFYPYTTFFNDVTSSSMSICIVSGYASEPSGTFIPCHKD